MSGNQRDEGGPAAAVEPIRTQLLTAAWRLCNKDDWTFRLGDVVAALPHLNPKSVNAEVNRCCTNAPRHHAKKWHDFRRVDRGIYEILPESRPDASDSTPVQESHVRRSATAARGMDHPAGQSVIHGVIVESEGWYVAECLEVAVVTQGRSLDETLANLRSALELHLDDQELARAGLSSSPRLVVSHETFALVSWMPRLKRLTSREVLSILRGFGFEVTQMRGSHAKLVRMTASGERQVLTVPAHPQLPIGAVQAIYRQASRFISPTNLHPKFFSD